jgi:hypothetical protein
LFENFYILSFLAVTFYAISVGKFRDSSVGIATDRMMAGESRFVFRQGKEIFLSTTASRPVPGPAQPPMQWVQLSVPWE